jgi:hypothetical protein
MYIDLLFGAIVFLVLIMSVILVFRATSSANAHPKSLPRPKVSYPDPVPGPSPTDVVQGVNTGMIDRNHHNEQEAIDTALMGHNKFVSLMNTDELSLPTLGMYTGVSNVQGGSLAVHS